MIQDLLFGSLFGDATTRILWKMANGQMPCMFHEFTGLYCPGCGGTRAAKALLKGRILDSFLFHPVVIYCAIIALIFAVSYLIYWKTKNPRYRLYLHNTYVYIGAGIIVINFVVKNYLLVAKGIDVLAMLPPV